MGKETPKRPDGIPDDVWADAGTVAREWMVEQARRLGLNSGKSSMPPSSDGPADVPKKTQRTPSGQLASYTKQFDARYGTTLWEAMLRNGFPGG